MNKPPLSTNINKLRSNNVVPASTTMINSSSLNLNNMSLTIGGDRSKNNALNTQGSKGVLLGVSRQRSSPIAIRRKTDTESSDNLWLSRSMPAPRAPIIGSMTEPSHLQQRIPDLSLPPSNPKISKSYGEVGTSMTRISASMPNTSFMATAANSARRQFLITRDNEIFDKDLTIEERQGMYASLEEKMKQPQSLSRSMRAGSSGGTRTALSILVEHPSESLLDELNLSKDGKDTVAASYNADNTDSENRRSMVQREEAQLNQSISDNDMEDDLNGQGDDDDDLFQMDE